MPNYGLTESWARGHEYKDPFNYVLGVGRVDSDEEADKYEAAGKQVVFLRRLDMGDLLKLGIAEELDFMSKELVTSEDPQKDSAKALGNAIMKSDNFTQMERMVNLVVTCGVEAPRLQMPPAVVDGAEVGMRQPGLTYADSIPFGDRMELFTIIFDTEGLSTFRSEQAAGVGDVEHEQSVQLPADGPVADVRSDDAERVLS